MFLLYHIFGLLFKWNYYSNFRCIEAAQIQIGEIRAVSEHGLHSRDIRRIETGQAQIVNNRAAAEHRQHIQDF